jgi:ribosomal protein S18 acetylase RimI-like enzyme
MTGPAPHVEIREAGPADARALAALYRESAEAHVDLDPGLYAAPDPSDVMVRAEQRLGGAGWAFVAIAGGRVVGVVETTPLPPPSRGSMIREVRAADVGIVVAADHRGTGIGRRLMEAAEDRAAREGVEMLVLDAHAANEPALRLYRSLGYDVTGIRMRKRID